MLALPIVKGAIRNGASRSRAKPTPSTIATSRPITNAVSQRGTWKEWLVYFLEGVRQQSQDAVNKVDRLQSLRIEYQAQIQSRRAPARLLKVVELFFAQPLLTTRQVETELGIPFAGAQRLIDQLIQFGMLREITGGRRNRIYRADQILAILESA